MKNLRVLQIAIPFTWFGMIAAISFMEAPLKFQAPGITLALGLGIGRLIFFVFNKMELVLAVAMLVSLVAARPKPGRFPVIAFGIVALLLILETAWLLPVLDARATEVMNGTAEPYSRTHLIYIAFDAVKLILLLLIGIYLTRQAVSRA